MEMENNGMFSNNISGGSGMLGLEMSLNNHPQQQQNSNFHHHQPPFAAEYTPKKRSSTTTDEEEQPHNNPSTTEESGGDLNLRKGSPWQRMKWTDNMVRLLIMVVFYIGDEVGSDQVQGSDTAAKKKSGAGGGGCGGGGVMQKKGKWKSVSKAMMERGFYVSPQQCEDKFNDLNKRYKRVNDILGKGTACKVVENQSLLENMDHLSPKMKEEARKLLNSKHLFFREMCAYHNTCGGGSGGSGIVHNSSPQDVAITEQRSSYRPNCVHDNDNDNDNDHEEEDDEEEDDGDEEDDEGLSSRKRGRMSEIEGYENVVQQFNGELSLMIQDMTKSVREKRQWVKVKMMQLEEQRVGYQGESYELEKQRLKWLKFSCKKEREMEIEKIRNERMKLENERMVLLLKQKEMELVDLQQQYSCNPHHRRTSDASLFNG
ncbi:uncharacterized protein [Rutidosis leptorrhynchoides]|uniref:uncharacterized protein n=1 Tax=Rutidosis leptorrhynchoides TaxID=125765 RepID=UPI003A994117